MTHALRVGGSEIPYELRRSATAAERRITVTPGHVEVLALATDDDEAIAGFLDRKRRWLFNTVREMERISAGRHGVPRLMTGSKIPYRGRQMKLRVRQTDGDQVEVSYCGGFVVDLPKWATGEQAPLVAAALKLWLRRQARRDARKLVEFYERRGASRPTSIRVGEILNAWGTCGVGGNVTINWQLIFAPRQVLEYVVVHELAHLRHRTHDVAFWGYVGALMPEFARPKRWLEAHQGSLSASFLENVVVEANRP